MKRSYAVLVPVFLGILFLAGSCAEILNPPDEAGQASAGKGRLSVQIEGAARTVLPSGVFDRYALRFVYNGTEGYVHADTEWSAALNVELEPGNWTVHADAYIGETAVGTGSAPVTVSAGSVAPVTIRITAIKTGTGVKGTLKYTVNYPANDANHAYTPGDLNVYSVEDWLDGVMNTPVTAPVANGTAGTVELEAGVYVVYTHIEDSVQRTAVTKVSAAHIYGDKETSLNVTVGAGEFTAFIPITGTAAITLPAWVTVNSRVIKAYSDPGCGVLSLAAEPALVSGGGAAGFTLRVSSVQGTVYLRQELEVQSGAETLTLFGAAQTVAIPPNQSEPIALTLPVTDVFYGVDTSGLSNGTVTAEPFAVLSGTTPTITLTVTPDSGYALGTLKYNDGSDYVISGPPYTFTMPALDVTVSAEFIKTDPVRYVTETGTGDGLSWVTASGDLQAMMDELAALYDSGLYSGPFVVKAAAGTYRPQYKPNADGTTDLTTPANDRDSAFILRKGVQVWGGYPASGGEDSSRNITAHVTTLSGDIDGDGTLNGNAYHVALGVNIPAGSGTVLDGLTITGGHSKDGYGDIPVAGKTIARADGGGLYNYDSSPALVDAIIAGNYANWGGGLYNMSSSPALINVIISGNIAGYGGGMVNNSSSPALVNVVISGNSTDYGGGGGTVDIDSSPALINVTISGNSALEYGGGMSNHDNSSSPVIRNSVIWGNTAGWSGSGGIDGSNPGTVISHSIVQDSGDTANGNKADPGTGAANSPFADWKDPAGVSMPNSEGDYGLAAGSPAINAGDNASYPANADDPLFPSGLSAEAKALINAALAKDLAGNTRKNGAIDMGAYEKY